jgi:high-affinity iron transporter
MDDYYRSSQEFHMLASFVLSLREGLEAALIIGVLLGSLKKLGQVEGQRTIWIGAGLAVILSALAGILLNLLGASFQGRAEEIFEGITMLLAAGILTWMIFWMRTQAREINQKLEDDVKGAVQKQSGFALFSLAFVAVIREGVELAIFLTAAAVDSNGLEILIGAGLGLTAVFILAILLFRSLIRLNLDRFFQITSIILILFAAGLVAHGIHEFNEAGIIPPIIEHIWDINHILDEKSTLGSILGTLLGYNGNPSLTEFAAYLIYLLVIGISWFRVRDRNTSFSP